LYRGTEGTVTEKESSDWWRRAYHCECTSAIYRQGFPPLQPQDGKTAEVGKEANHRGNPQKKESLALFSGEAER
jgi:hypothetical protein